MKAYAPKNRKLNKKPQEKEYEIKRNLRMADINWNDWEFQIHWNKLEWVNPRNFNEQMKTILCVF